jgi:hypothetical protein
VLREGQRQRQRSEEGRSNGEEAEEKKVVDDDKAYDDAYGAN